MRRQSFFIGLGLTALTSLGSLSVSLSASFGQSTTSESQPNKVTFFCRQIIDKASGENIPATVAWIPERQGHIRFVAWKFSRYLENLSLNLSPKRRETLKFPPSLRSRSGTKCGKKVEGLGQSLAFPHNVKSQTRVEDLSSVFSECFFL